MHNLCANVLLVLSELRVNTFRYQIIYESNSYVTNYPFTSLNWIGIVYIFQEGDVDTSHHYGGDYDYGETNVHDDGYM